MASEKFPSSLESMPHGPSDTSRWLSVLDVSLDTLCLWDAFVIFHYAFLGNEDRATYKDIVNGILEKRGVQEAGWTHIKELWKELRIRSKNFTNEGKMRKARIYKKVRNGTQSSTLKLCKRGKAHGGDSQ